jgi:hypothetical protein
MSDEHLETQNLARWVNSGEPRRWVDAHQRQWNHNDWLALLVTLRTSNYWPMEPNAIGLVIESLKHEMAVTKPSTAEPELLLDRKALARQKAMAGNCHDCDKPLTEHSSRRHFTCQKCGRDYCRDCGGGVWYKRTKRDGSITFAWIGFTCEHCGRKY